MNYAFVKTDQCDVRVMADMIKAVAVKGRDLGREENTDCHGRECQFGQIPLPGIDDASVTKYLALGSHLWSRKRLPTARVHTAHVF